MRDVALVRKLDGIPDWGVVGTLVSKDSEVPRGEQMGIIGLVGKLESLHASPESFIAMLASSVCLIDFEFLK